MFFSHNGRVLLHLSLIKGIGPRSILSLLYSLEKIDIKIGAERGQCGNQIDLQKWYHFTTADLVNKGCSYALAEKVVNGLTDHSLVEKEIENAELNGISWISCLDPEYPPLLQEISTPPIGLYVKGSLPIHDQLKLGIVGSRLANQYAKRALDFIATPFVLAGGEIISGGALGVDGMAHGLAVQYQKPTTVVLGSGLLSLYPKQNLYLFDEVLATGGTLISSFPLETGPERGNFPMRNRIIAGLSQAVLVVQAAEKSGALITAEYALEEGRPVSAIPGPIDDPLSAGCHALIKQGASLIRSYDDLCQELGCEIITTSQEQNLSLFSEPKKEFISEPHFSKVKQIVHQDPLLALLEKPAHAEFLMTQLSCSLDEIEDRLFSLQLDGVIMQRIDGSWVLTKN
jgi:DNA processing protein